MQLSRGFTLLELIMTMAVVAILASLTVSLGSMITDNRRTGAVSDVLSGVAFARSQAMSRGVTVTMCRSSDQVACNTGVGWESGWIVFIDASNPGVIDPGETILFVHGALNSNQTIRGNIGVANRITFNPFGVASGTSGTLLVCDSRGVGKARAVVLGVGGGALSYDPATILSPATTPLASSCPTPT